MTEVISSAGKRRLLSPFFLELLAIIFLVEFIKGSLLVAILPVYMKNVLGVSGTIIGISFALQYLGDNLFRSPSGWIAERLGFKTTMAAALFMVVAGVVIIAFTDGPFWLSLACLILGIGTAPLWPCAMTGATEISGPNNSNGTAMGALETAALAGTGAGPITMNFIMEHTSKNYQTAFLIMIGVGIVLVLTALLLPGKIKRPSIAEGYDAVHVQGNRLRNSLSKLRTSVKATLHEVKATLNVSWLVYPALFLQSSVIGLLSPVITLYVSNELGISPNQYSLLLIVGGGITVLALIPAGKLVDRFGTTRFLNAGFLLCAITLCIFTSFKSLPIVFGLVSLVGIAYAMILPAWNTFVANLVPKGERGTVWGFFLTLQGSGMVFGPILSGWLWDGVGHGAPFVASGIIMGILFIIHLFLSRRHAPPVQTG
ncbi:MFS transporter [Paenibacillus dakarensis]|uniref:MFS transporter n=1 Tax=Paenibacillus dakarensis TaxID=1527293 RepID=UPI0006D59422|nr:MFS transporter [Paenibacillus dakarensis]